MRLRHGALALCVAIAATLLTVLPNHASGGGLPGTHSASSSASGAGPGLAFDGNHGTAWTAAGGGQAWLKLDLGSEFSVSSVRHTFTSRRLWSFVVEGSADDQTWLPLADRRTGLMGNRFAFDVSGRYRYVRLLVTAAEGNAAAGVREMDVSGTVEADLALGRTAFADSAKPGFEAGKAIDGDSSTYWVADNGSQSHTLTVDLGAPRTFTAVEHHLKDHDWINFTIRGSNDPGLPNDSWAELARHTPPLTNPPARGQVYRFAVSATYRYVRLSVTDVEGDHWVGSVSFRVLGPAVGAAERDLAAGVSAKSSSLIDNQTPAKAVDGNTGTAWVADGPGQPQWLLVDLGNKAMVNRIEQSFADSSGWTFTIQASADGQSWTTVTSGAHSGRVFSYPLAGTYRYFKLTIPGASTGGHWPASQSFKVFGNGSPVTTRWWMDHGPVMRYYPKHYRTTLNQITAGLDDLKRKGYRAIEVAAPYESPWTPWAGLGATNNYTIDPLIGTMADFENLLTTAHAKGMKVIMFGNPGYAHPDAPFFRRAEQDPNSLERKWFDFTGQVSGPSQCGNNGYTGWFYSATARACYFVQWSTEKEPPPPPGEDPLIHMPAYNFGNQEWRDENAKILRFWMDKGLDGFGADAPRVYRNISNAISHRYITDVLNAYEVWALPEGLQPHGPWNPGDLLNGIPELHYNVIHDLFINHWGCPDGQCGRIIPAIDNQNPSALELAFKLSRDEINQQGGNTLTMPSWEYDLIGPRVPADKRLLEIATLATMGSQFFLHYGNHRYLPHEQTIPTWTTAQQEQFHQLLQAQTNHAALQSRGLRVQLHTNDDNKYYAYKRTSRNGGTTALVVMNYQNSTQQITVDLSQTGISTDQTPVNLLTGEPATPMTGSTYTLTLPARQFAVLDVTEPASLRTTVAPQRVINSDFPDPDVLQVGSTYYAYSTSTGAGRTPVASAPSANGPWTVHGDALPNKPSWAGNGGFWAPDVSRRSDGSYLMYFTGPSAAVGRMCIGAAVSANPLGPFTPVGNGPLVCNGGEGGDIDPSSFVDTGGQRYLLYKNDGNAVGQPAWIWLQPVAANGVTLAGGRTALLRDDRADEAGVIESPVLVRRSSQYVLFYSANVYSSPYYHTSYAVSGSITGPYTKAFRPLVTTDSVDGSVEGPAGADVAEGKIFFHGWLNGGRSARGMYVADLGWVNDYPTVRGSRVRYEAERGVPHNCQLRSGAVRASQGAVVAYIDHADSWVDVTVFVPTAGAYTAYVGYAAGAGDARHLLTVNGGAQQVVDYPAHGWDNWNQAAANVTLNAGLNTLRFQNRTRWAELDYVEVA